MTAERCRFCRRKLKDPLCMRVGFGPTCGKKHGLAVKVTVEKSAPEGVTYADAATFF